MSSGPRVRIPPPAPGRETAELVPFFLLFPWEPGASPAPCRCSSTEEPGPPRPETPVQPRPPDPPGPPPLGAGQASCWGRTEQETVESPRHHRVGNGRYLAGRPPLVQRERGIKPPPAVRSFTSACSFRAPARKRAGAPLVPYLRWLERPPHKRRNPGSNPGGTTRKTRGEVFGKCRKSLNRNQNRKSFCPTRRML